METVPRSACFSFGCSVAVKVLLEAEPDRRPHIEEPPSESEEVGPRGSPVWKEKFFWME
jgi:hypothetical protein